MDVVSLPLYRLARSPWLTPTIALGLLSLLVLLAYAVGLAGISEAPPDERVLVAPFRWRSDGAGEG